MRDCWRRQSVARSLSTRTDIPHSLCKFHENLGVKTLVRFAKEPQQFPMFVVEIEDHGPFPRHPQPVNAYEIVEDPARCGVLDWFARLVGKRLPWSTSALRMRYSKAA